MVASMWWWCRLAHDLVKVNQCQYMYIEDCDISGADDNAVDFVAVQYGHVHGNRIHNAQDWCMYTKGGFEGSEVWWYPMGETTHASDVGTVGDCNKHHRSNCTWCDVWANWAVRCCVLWSFVAPAGGSAYISVSENEFFDCGTGGFTAGQGTGLEFMVAPWLHYSAYAITVTQVRAWLCV